MYFPFFENIDDKNFLIVGGGNVAWDKFSKLKEFTDNITLIAREFSFDTENARIITRDFATADISGADIVIAATDDHDVNREIGRICHEKGIPVNVVDDPSECDFIFPSIVKRGDVTVAISTNGASPALSQYLRKKTEEAIPDSIRETVDFMRRTREIVKEKIASRQIRKYILKKLLDARMNGEDAQALRDILIRAFAPHEIILATRGSALALTQSDIVKRKLVELGMTVTLKVVKTSGDKDRKSQLARIGGRGVFVKEIERVLLDGEADIAVHSGKDLPSEIADGLVIAATPEAASDRDVMLSFTDTPKRIGTGSLRRITQLKKTFPSAEFIPIRGNVDTRIRKLRDGEVDAIIVAQAGLDRLGIDVSDFKVRVFSDDECLPAATQGIMAVECRSDRTELRALLSLIDDPATHERFNAERLFIKVLGADCTAPAAARCYLTGGSSLTGHVSLNMSSYVMPVMYEGRRVTFNGVLRFIERDLTPEIVNRLLGPGQSGHVPRSYQGNKNVRASESLGKVYIVGAGPSYDLLTLRAKYLIEHADVIVYDDLIDRSVLSYARPEADLQAVGKRRGSVKATQDEINNLLVRLAESGRCVVRLKGGDPFVFGRGAEEAQALESRDIEYEIIPGISTCIAVPEHFGIPVTNRGSARSFSVITGHTAAGSGDDTPLQEFGRINGSRIFLMGITELTGISEDLIRGGASPDTPVAVMSRAFSSDEAIIRGTLSDIAVKAENAGMPGIIFVGENATMQLSNRRRRSVTITGSGSFTSRGRKILSEAGFDVKTLAHLVTAPTVQTLPEHFEEGSILTFTSANGVDIFFRKYHYDIRHLAGVRFAVIGHATSQELERHGIYPDIMPDDYTTEALCEEIKKSADGGRVYLLRASNGSRDLYNDLIAAGTDTTDIALYDTQVRCDLLDGYICNTDYIIFGSAYGARSFAQAGASVGDSEVICIGQRSAREYGGECLIPEKQSFESILELLSVRTIDQ